ncbi:hypothetical protein GP486_006019 [Trichoglossum hirsutum]|uniref:Pyridoxal-dependent decarboxylase n=1 Tax=Trichoglossum hirsutum TaxID=265104 RepID=A0A9P8RLJ5_9PEZI|nr:hypothetical protein GP486_006019 [Trichoglossum hirsutum]
MDEFINDVYSQTHSKLVTLLSENTPNILPMVGDIEGAVSSLTPHLPNDGLGTHETIEHLMKNIVPALNASSLSPNYYGFVTGGTTPAACIADQIVSIYDQNVQVHLPKETIATAVEDRALKMLLELLELDPTRWTGRTFTTGATASNVLGLACARDHVVQNFLQRKGVSSISVANSGLIAACLEAGIRKIQILTAMPHSSLGKASSIAGLGRTAIEVLPLSDDQPWRLNLQKLEEKLKTPGTASIVAISCGEVNTGRFSTESIEELGHIRALCDIYHAWIHIDGDVTQQVFQNSNAAYLTSATTTSSDNIRSPLNIGIENSRRFRALPVYATLTAYGRRSYQKMLARQIRFARAVADYILKHPAFELLPQLLESHEDKIRHTYIIVLFCAKDDALNRELVQMINATGKIYVSGTTWGGKPASRIAASNWRVDEERDFSIVRNVLEEVLGMWRETRSGSG